MKKNIIIATIILLIITILISVLMNSGNEKLIYLTDTVKLTDTVFRKYERVVPKKIIIHKIDTLRIIKEVIGKAEMKRDELTVITQDEKDSTIREYEFKNIYRDFILYSDSGGINAYKKNTGWDGIKIKTGLSKINMTESINPGFYIGAETGMYYKRLNFNIGINYFPFTHQYGFDVNVSIRIE